MKILLVRVKLAPAMWPHHFRKRRGCDIPANRVPMEAKHRCNCHLADALLMQLHDFFITTFALLSSCLLLHTCFCEGLLHTFFFACFLSMRNGLSRAMCCLLLGGNALEALMFAFKEADHRRLKIHKEMKAVGNLPR